MKRNKKGYTLVELIVVLTILTIFIGAAAFGLYSYTRYSKFKNYNENAQSIYTAAQQALTHYKASGQLNDFAKNVEKYALKTSSGKIINPEIPADFSNRLYTIFYCADSSKSSKGYDDDSRALFEALMDRYLGDPDLMNGNIALEFDPNDGVVYSVSYSLQANELYYGTNKSDDNNETVVDITDRSESVRKERMFGYFDVNTLSTPSPSKGSKPSITDLELVNSEELYLRWRLDDNYNDVSRNFKYKINLYDGAVDYSSTISPLMSLEVNTNSNNIPSYTTENSPKEITCEVSKPGVEKASYQFRSYFKEENGATYFYLILDAVDLGDFTTDENNNQILKEDLNNTYSIRRFNLTNTIYARMSASGQSYRSSAWKQSNKQDIMYNSRSEEHINQGNINKITAEIANNRHLFNIRFNEDYYSSAMDFNHYEYKQTSSFDYQNAQIYQTSNETTSDGNIANRTVNEYVDNELPSFSAIAKLNINSAYTSKGYSIKNLLLGKEEQDDVGLFITNEGVIDGIKLEDVKVIGRDNVGAVATYNANMINNSTVSGNVFGEKNIGGICSQIVNHGIIINTPLSGNENQATITGSENVGGIIGNLINTRDESSGKLFKYTVKDCNNTGKITENNVGEVSNLGGIAGSNIECIIENCTSSPEWKIDEAIDMKSKANNVGGIAGYNEGKVVDCSTGRSNQASFVVGNEYVGGIVGKQVYPGSIVNSSPTSKSNRCNVIGNKYVGGITGINEHNSSIDSLTNEGVIICRLENGGGIAGENSGILSNCRSYVRRNALTIDYDIVKEENKDAINLGGIAGFNTEEGSIVQDSGTQKNISFVIGKSNIGGIVGYNQGEIKNQELTGGYVIGTGDNIGGYIGFNTTIRGINNNDIFISLNEVSGNDNIGGVIGNNKITYDGNFTVRIDTNSFSGNVKGKEAIGGYIGLNQATGSGMMTITSKDGKNAMNQIEGSIYVGGIIGKNISDGTKKQITISDIANQTRIISTGVETVGNINYSYTSGIIGENGTNMIIDGCSNQKSIEVSNQATYLGGLVEVNNGTVKNSNVYSLGSYSRSNVGGLAGINKGTINNCEIQNGTITGKDNVGGLVVDNHGTITNINNSTGNIVASGKNIGGLVANNYGEISDTNTSITINSTGQNVGGIVGYNKGSLKNINIASSNSVKGNENVGGIIGYQDGSNLTKLTNLNDVTATNANAGGIVGDIAKVNSSISNCSNSGKVVCSGNKGYAGGIIPTVASGVTIDGCTNTGDVQSTYYYAGGIAAKNEGIISSSTVDDAEIRGKNYTGGITTYNYGKIADCEIGDINLTVNGFIAGNDVEIGGVCAFNSANGEIENTGSLANKTLSIKSIYINSYLGGIAGKNEGTIKGDKTIIKADINKDINNQFDINIGGVTARNDGTIDNYVYSGVINGNGGSDYGYGGIAGINNKTIIDCQSSAVTITTKGDSANPANTGGIAGINNGTVTNNTIKDTNKIESTGFGNLGGIVGLNYGDISDSIHQDDNGVIVDGNTNMKVASGDIGGIAGKNKGEATVNNCATSKNWQISSDSSATDTAAGGIVGYSDSSAILYQNLNNYTPVTKSSSTSAGGIFGRLENNSTRWTIQNCTNSGNITSNQGRTGGMIGQLKYRGGDIINCTNTGNIKDQINNENGVGGITGFLYAINANEELVISDCTNLGDVSGKYAGGITGYQNEIKNNVKVYINNCKNAGMIAGRTQAAGISVVKNDSSEFYINNNVNYYKFETSEAAGIAYINNNTKVKEFSNNIDAGISNNPSSNKSDFSLNKNNYYFTNDESIVDQNVIDIDALKASDANNKYITKPNNASIANNSGIDKLVDNTNTGLSINMKTSEAYDPSVKIKIPLKKASTINNITIDWYNLGTQRKIEYYYRLTLNSGQSIDVYEDDGDKKFVKEFKDSESTDKLNRTDVVTIELIVTSCTHTYVAINELRINNVDNIVIDTTGQEGTSMLTVKKSNEKWDAENENDGIAIVGMDIDPTITKSPTEDTLAIYKYKNLDLKITGYQKGEDRDYRKSNPPVINEYTDLGGIYKIPWSFDTDASQYEVSINVDGQQITRTVYGNKFTNIALDPSWYGKELRVKVRAKSLDEANCSPWSDLKTITVKTPLATPQLHFVNRDGQDKFYAVIDNIDDYEMDDTITVTGKNLNLKIRLENGKKILVDSNGNKNPSTTNNNNNNNNITIVAVASPSNSRVNNYGKSITYSAQTKLYMIDSSELKVNEIKLNGFKGTSADSLRYEIGFDTASMQAYYRQDLLLNDDKLDGLEVVESSSKYRINENATDMKTELSSIPEKIGDYAGKQVRVQSYLWETQNYVTQYYYYLDGLKEVNSEIINNNLNTFSDVVNGQRQMKKGYVIERIDDDLYSVFYNSALASAETGTDPTTKRYVSTYVNVPDKVSAVTTTKPTIIDNHYTVSWNDDKPENNPNYQLIVYGSMAKDADGNPINEIELVNEEINGNSLPDYITKNGNSYVYTELQSSDQWNYKYLRVVVNHYGTENSTGYTYKLSNTTSDIYEYKLRLSQITAPQVSIIDGHDSYTYNVLWNNYIAEEGTSEQDKQINAVDYFEVVAKSKTADGNVYTRTVKYPVTDENRNNKDFTTTIELTFDEDNPINDNEDVEFYVNAIALDDNPSYTNSIDGDKTIISLPHRLKQPFTFSEDKLIVPEGPINIEEIERNGIEIKMNSNSKEAELYDNANYQLDYSLDGINYLRSENPLTLDGNIKEGSINLKEIISGDNELVNFAGKTIYVKLRLVSSNAVSSPWSDVQIVKIPKAKLVLETDDVIITSKHHSVNNSNDELYDPMLNQKVLSVPYLQYSNGYNFDITYNKDVDAKYQYYHELKYKDPISNDEVSYPYYNDSIKVIDNGIDKENRFTITYKEYFIKTDGYGYPIDQNGVRLVGDNIEDNLIVESNDVIIEVPALSVINNVYTIELDVLSKTYSKEVNGNTVSVTLTPRVYINVDTSGNVLSYQYELLDTLSKEDPAIGIESTKAVTKQVLINAIGINENYVDSQHVEFYRYSVGPTYQDGLRIFEETSKILLVMEKLFGYEICYYYKNEYFEGIA